MIKRIAFFLLCFGVTLQAAEDHELCDCRGNNPQKNFDSELLLEPIYYWEGSGDNCYCSNDPVAYEQQICFGVDFNPLVHCDYFIDFDFNINQGTQRRLERMGGQGFIDYNLYKNPGQSGLLLPLNIAQADNLIIRDLNGTEVPPVQECFYWHVPALQLAPAGIYYDRNINVTLHIGYWDGDFCRGDQPFQVDFCLQVCPYIDLSIVEPGGSFAPGDTEETLSFGIVSPGDFLEADVLVIANEDFDLYFRSENSNVLVHEDSLPGGILPYTLRVNNVIKDLSSGNDELVGTSNGMTPVGGELFRTRVTIDNFGSIPSGHYEDIIYVTVTCS